MPRLRWSSRTVFFLAAIGSAVGLGNIWRFPYLAYEFGGGAFLVPYLIVLFVLGIPLLTLEFAIGQKLQKGAVASFRTIHPRLTGIGLAAIFCGFVVVVYYAVIMAWTLIFFLNSFQTELPWSSDAQGYFFGTVLRLSEGADQMGGINLSLLISLFITWLIIYFCVWKGVKSIGRIIMVTMPLPLILLILLFIRGITLEGAWTGIYFYLNPDFSTLLDTEIWLAAASQIFFTLTLGFGVMIAYASYNRQDQDVSQDALVTAVANSIISLFAGFVVFSVLGYMATVTGVDVEEVVASGPGLAFVVFPQALSLMPWAWFFSALFFLVLLSLGINSAFSLVESVDTVIADQTTRFTPPVIASIVCTVAFLLGIIFTTRAGLYYLDIIDHFITSFGLVLVGVFQCIAIGWIYGIDRLESYINRVSARKKSLWWSVSIRYVVPIILSVLVIVQFITELQGNYQGYPTWAISMGWMVAITPLLIGGYLAIRRRH